MAQKGKAYQYENEYYRVKNYHTEEVEGEPSIYYEVDFINTSEETYSFGSRNISSLFMDSECVEVSTDIFEELRSLVKQQMSNKKNKE